MENKNARLPRNYSMLTDWYEFMMDDCYELCKKGNAEVAFDVFFRKVPSNGGYAIMAGIDKVIEYVQKLKFGERELDYFIRQGYSKEFIEHLRNFKFTGDIYAIPDGTPVFPNEPVITIKAPIIEAQILETAILSIVNGAMEHATGARRIIEAANGVPVMEFGARRADGLDAAIDASIYGVMAGCKGTSNVLAADMMNMKALGTMAHSYIESFDTELEAFKRFALNNPDNATLLVDTYDTLRSGVPNAIETFKYLRNYGIKANIGIRIDSGDLAYLSKEARRMLDEAGFYDAKIVLSNGLTAETIETLFNQGARFDSLGVGDNISKPEGRMGCVYKEVAIEDNGVFVPRIKLSNDTIKIVNPGYKKLYRAFDRDTGYALADVMTLYNRDIRKKDLIIVCPTDKLKNKRLDNIRLVELQRAIFKNGKLVYDDPDIRVKQQYCDEQMRLLYPEIRRAILPHEYYVDLSDTVRELRNDLISQHKSKKEG